MVHRYGWLIFFYSRTLPIIIIICSRKVCTNTRQSKIAHLTITNIIARGRVRVYLYLLAIRLTDFINWLLFIWRLLIARCVMENVCVCVRIWQMVAGRTIQFNLYLALRLVLYLSVCVVNCSGLAPCLFNHYCGRRARTQTEFEWVYLKTSIIYFFYSYKYAMYVCVHEYKEIFYIGINIHIFFFCIYFPNVYRWKYSVYIKLCIFFACSRKNLYIDCTSTLILMLRRFYFIIFSI